MNHLFYTVFRSALLIFIVASHSAAQTSEEKLHVEDAAARIKSENQRIQTEVAMLRRATEKKVPDVVYKHFKGTKGTALKFELVPPGFKSPITSLPVSKLTEPVQPPMAEPVLFHNCSESKTEKEPLDGPRKRTKTALKSPRTHDMLFLRASDMLPLDEHPFGPGVVVLPVADDDPAISNFAMLLGAPCLPFRRRVTEKYIFTHTGEHALKSYVDDPNGKGLITEIAAAKFGLTSSKSKKREKDDRR